MKKYGLIIYDQLPNQGHKFDVVNIDLNDVQVWPLSSPTPLTDKSGQTQYIWPRTLLFKVVEDINWGLVQDTAITEAVAAWDLNNPDRLIPPTLQLIYSEEEAINIPVIFENERQRLINELP